MRICPYMTSTVKLSGAARRLLVARTLTHAGDQAWDFAVPLALAAAFPGRLGLSAKRRFGNALSGLFDLAALLGDDPRQDVGGHHPFSWV